MAVPNPKRKSDLFGRFLLLFGSISVALIVAEISVRLMVPVRLVGPSVTEYDPTYGYRLRPGLTGSQSTPEFTWHFSFNSRGRRGPEPQSESPSIFFLGDSFTLGFGVDDGEEFPMLVGERLNRGGDGVDLGVVNAGLGNSGQGRWVKLLHSEAPALRPCLVVFQILANDFEDNIREDFFRVSPDGTLEERPIAPMSPGRRAQQLLQAVPLLTKTYLYGLVRQAYHGRSAGAVPTVVPAGAGHDPTRDLEESLTYRLVDEAATIVGNRGWPAIALVVDLPPTRLERVLEIFAEHGIPAEPISGKEQHPEWYYRIDGHWNQAGHENAADLVLSMMSQYTGLACGV